MKKNIILLIALLPFALFGQNVAGDAICLSESEYLSYPAVNFQMLQQASGRTFAPMAQFSGSVMLLTPTPGDQGSQGSCTAWATAYAALGTLAYDKFDQNMTLAKRSPAFVFNSIVNDDGEYRDKYTADAVRFISEQGTCSWNSMVYDQYDQATLPTNDNKFEAGINRALNYGAIHDVKDVMKYKEAIYLGYPVVVNLYVTNDFRSMWSGDGVWRKTDFTFRGNGHAVCVVGYDDSKKMFKVMNSWGTTGGDKGYFWVTYDLVSQGCFREAYVISDICEDVNPTISGNEKICDSQLYSVVDLPTGAKVSWSSTANFMFKRPFCIDVIM